MPKLGIIAGGGAAPQRLIETCRKLGRPFFVVCLEGQAEPGFAEDVAHAWIHLGAFGKLKALAESEALKEVVLIGRVRRPSLAELKPDWLALKLLPKIGLGAFGDDALMRAVGKAIEDEVNVRVIGAHEVFSDLLTPVGQLGRTAPDEDTRRDIARGIEVAAALGRLDVGQAAVVQQGIVLGVEGIEGTDALIARCGGLRREGPGGVLVKIAKPQQDVRFDLPTIGPDTVAAVVKAGLRGIAIEAGRSLLIEREKTIEMADQAGLFVIGLSLADVKTDG